jgi:hypothetical protein
MRRARPRPRTARGAGRSETGLRLDRGLIRDRHDQAIATLMALQHCLGLYDEEKIASAPEPSACKYSKEPVSGSEVGTRLPALEHSGECLTAVVLSYF